MVTKLRPREKRTFEQLRHHYEVEKELANRLRQSRKEERPRLYSDVYNELFQRVPLHPQLTRVHCAQELAEIAAEKLRLLSRFLKPETVFLELGAGDCRLSLEAAKRVKHVYALDICEEVHTGVQFPKNLQFVLSDGTSIPVPAGSVTVAYSYQLLEHIHPNDVIEQLANVYRALAPGGVYLCVTPNRLSGPHDISGYFDTEATGFHMKEYTYTELGQVFRAAGFGTVNVLVGARNRYIEVPVSGVRGLEGAVACLPHNTRRSLLEAPLIRNVLRTGVVGKKL
jgi:SAM-dependent methyltransferase